MSRTFSNKGIAVLIIFAVLNVFALIAGNMVDNDYEYVEIVERIPIAAPPSLIDKMEGDFSGFLSIQDGSLEQVPNYQFYLINNDGLRQLKQFETEGIFISNHDEKPYIEVTWTVRKHRETGEFYGLSDDGDQNRKKLIGFSNYAEYGKLQKFVIFANMEGGN